MTTRVWWLAAGAVFCCAWGGNQFTPLLLMYRAGAAIGTAMAVATSLRVPAAGHQRFRWIVVPMAPWVFGSAGIGYAVMPRGPATICRRLRMSPRVRSSVSAWVLVSAARW